MPAEIHIEKVKEGEFRVRVKEGGSESRHRVTLSETDYLRLSGGKIDAVALVRVPAGARAEGIYSFSI